MPLSGFDLFGCDFKNIEIWYFYVSKNKSKTS